MFLKKINKDFILLSILVIFGIITHIEWFNPFSILNDSDWFFWYDESIKTLNKDFSAWVSFFDLGMPNIQIYFNIFKILWWSIVGLGFSYDIAVKITFLIPIAIGGFVSPYILVRKLIKDKFISFIGALFYGTTTYFMLRQTAHIPIAFVYMIAPVFIYIFIKLLEENKTKDWIIFSLLNIIMIGYEIRMVYILYWIILIYWLVFFKKKYLGIKYIKNYIIYGISLILLNVYWILPTLKGSTDAIKSTANRGLFGGHLFNIKRAITISESSWTGGYPNMDFVPQAIPIVLFIVPITILIGFLFIRNSKYKIIKRTFIFFGIISFIGVILTSQQAAPLFDLYQWLYENFPGFNLFREASKFYMITAMGYLGLLSISLKLIKDNLYKIKLEKIYYISGIFLIGIFVYNTKPLITKEIGTMFVSKQIPVDYLVLKNKIEEEDEYFRNFWTPTISRYGIFSSQNSIMSNILFSDMYWQDIFKETTVVTDSIEKRIMGVYQEEYSNRLFDNSNIRYIVLPIEDAVNDSDFYKYYGRETNPEIRQWYIEQLDKLEWLEKIDLGLEELVVYENEDYKDRIYLTEGRETIYKDIENKEVEFEQINSTEYKVKINNLDSTEYLNFVEAYDPNWKLRIGYFDWKEVLYQNNYFLEDEKHTKSDINVNSYELSKEYIKANYDPKYYKKNPDGSIDIELTLYFKPQSYFYLGIIISGTTLILCLGYLGYDFWKNRKRKLEQDK